MQRTTQAGQLHDLLEQAFDRDYVWSVPLMRGPFNHFSSGNFKVPVVVDEGGHYREMDFTYSCRWKKFSQTGPRKIVTHIELFIYAKKPGWVHFAPRPDRKADRTAKEK